MLMMLPAIPAHFSLKSNYRSSLEFRVLWGSVRQFADRICS